MGRTARERLATLLDDAEAPGAFSTQILAPADALQVEVDGVGAVPVPVRGPLAKRLIAAGRPAKFGRAEQTLTDAGVRDTWEITPDPFHPKDQWGRRRPCWCRTPRFGTAQEPGYDTTITLTPTAS